MNQQQNVQKEQVAQNKFPKTVKSKEQNKPADIMLQKQNIIGNHGILQCFGRSIVQAKLNISQPDDIYEQEADMVADEVMRMPEPMVQRQTEEEEEEPVQAKGDSQKEDIPEGFDNTLHAMKGGGQPLPKSARDFFEPRFGVNFNHVRIHDTESANHAALSLNAHSFTIGEDIFFGEGQYNPDSLEGKKLLSHELVHTFQQKPTEKYSISYKKAKNKPSKKSSRRTPSVKEEVNQLTKREDLWNHLSLVRDKLEKQKVSWEKAAIRLGSAYRVAYEEHKKALEGRSKQIALEEAIVFGVLTAASGGLLGWLGEAKAFGPKIGQIMAGGLEDAVQQAVGEGIDIVQAQVAPSAQNLSQHPQVFQNDLIILLDDQWEKVLEFFIHIKTKLFGLPLQAFELVDIKMVDEVMNEWLADNKFMKSPTLFPQKVLQEELERGMWAKWAPSLEGYPTLLDPEICSKVGVCETVPTYSSPKSDVEKRLDKLDITKACGVGDWGWLYSSDYEISLFISWARKFKVHKFEF